MEAKEIGSGTIFGIAKRQLLDRLQNRIIVADFREVTGTFKGFMNGIKGNPSVSFGRNERVYGQNEDSGLSAVFRNC